MGERQRIFSAVGEHSVLPCRDLFAVSDTVLLHMRVTLRSVRHNRAAQIVNLDIADGTCELRLSRSLHSQRFTLGIILHFQFSILHTEIDNQNFHKNRVRPHSTARTLLFT